MKKLVGGLVSFAALVVFFVMAINGTLKFLEEADDEFFFE